MQSTANVCRKSGRLKCIHPNMTLDVLHTSCKMMHYCVSQASVFRMRLYTACPVCEATGCEEAANRKGASYRCQQNQERSSGQLDTQHTKGERVTSGRKVDLKASAKSDKLKPRQHELMVQSLKLLLCCFIFRFWPALRSDPPPRLFMYYKWWLGVFMPQR